MHLIEFSVIPPIIIIVLLLRLRLPHSTTHPRFPHSQRNTKLDQLKYYSNSPLFQIPSRAPSTNTKVYRFQFSSPNSFPKFAGVPVTLSLQSTIHQFIPTQAIWSISNSVPLLWELAPVNIYKIWRNAPIIKISLLICTPWVHF